MGTAVLCRYGGGEAKFPGKIAAAHADGSYDVAYDDGDAEQGVSGDLIEELGALRVGDVVTARFGGGEQAFAGRVEGVNGDGTYSVVYDDGDKEDSVGRELIVKTGS